MENSGLSVTRIFNDLKNGDHSAAGQLWCFLQKRLMNLSRNATRHDQKMVYDEQDVALSAFFTLCDGCESQRYDNIANRDELWRLLAVITVNKARKKAAHENRLKRGGGLTRVDDGDALLRLLPDGRPGPEVALLMQDECSRLLQLLGKKELQLVALHKVEGHTNEEIAARLGCTRRAVQRRLSLIRNIWAGEVT